MKCLINHISIGGINITNIRYADDVVLIAGSIEESQRMVDKVKGESEKTGLISQCQKSCGKCPRIWEPFSPTPMTTHHTSNEE